MQHKINIYEKAKIPAFKEFGTELDTIEFYVTDFHEYYDGLIGNDLLRPLKARICYESDTIKIGENTLQLIVRSKDQYKENIEQEENNYVNELHKNGIIEDPLNIELNFASNSQPLKSQIRIDHLNSEEKTQLLPIINKYHDIFYQENKKLSFTSAIKHSIRTTTNIPIFTKSYRYPYIHKNEVENQIQEMLNNGIIRHSNSPYSAPIWIVPKKADASGKAKWRLVVDYRKLNEVTIDDKYPIPNIDEILDKLGRCQYFTTLDLAKGFHQIEIEEQDIHKTAFSVEGGHYEFLRMPFGLKTAPATFQRLMNNILKDYVNKICLVYLDDVIIFSTSLQEHINSIKLIFNRLKDANLKIQLDKSEFLKRETEFLGHIITPAGIKTNPKKIECVKNFPIPKNTKQIKQFLGLTGYYRKFIKDYSLVAKPMTKYLKKDTKLDISDPEYEKSFNTLKTLLINDPILAYPDFSKQFTLTTDASNYALGAILSQNGHPICYASRTLNTHEINYSTIEKELLAIIWATKYFRPYLFGRRFIIETDHKPLTWLFSIKEPNSKLVRWRLKLSEFDYQIKYKKGVKNGNADALSRIELDAGNINTLELNHPTIKETKSPINIFKNQIVITKITSGSLRIKNKSIFGNNRKTIHTKELDRETAIILLKNHFNPAQLNAVLIEEEFYTMLETTFKELFANNTKFRIIRCFHLVEDVEDEETLTEIIKGEHLDKNHRGIQAVFKELITRIYNPKLKLRITQFINNCEICNLEKYERKPPKIPYKMTETPSRPREVMHLDVFYTLEKKLFMTAIDKFSKFAMAFLINGRNWTEFKTKILQIINTYGKVNKFIVDNELGFKAIPMQQFLKEENIEIHFTSNSNHTSNADIERLHNTINEHIRLLRHDDKNRDETIEDKMTRIIGFYNNTIHSTTGIKPIDFLNGKIHEDKYKEIQNLINSKKERYIQKLNKHRKDIELEDGTNYIREIRGGKNHRKYRKVNTNKIDQDHIQTLGTGHKYYKSNVKHKRKYQDRDNPTIKSTK